MMKRIANAPKFIDLAVEVEVVELPGEIVLTRKVGERHDPTTEQLNETAKLADAHPQGDRVRKIKPKS